MLLSSQGIYSGKVIFNDLCIGVAMTTNVSKQSHNICFYCGQGRYSDPLDMFT